MNSAVFVLYLFQVLLKTVDKKRSYQHFFIPLWKTFIFVEMRKLKVTEMNRLSLTEFHASDKFPLVVVLDHVRSLYNVGSVFRTSDAFRLQGVCLCGITANPPHPEIHKTALGAEDSVEWKYFERTEDAVEMLLEQGYTVLAVEQCEGSMMLQDFKYEKDRKYAIVLGNEVKGVQQQIVDRCNGCLEIPQYGTKHSMNVSVTAGIVIWAIVAPSLPVAPPVQ